MGRSTPVSPAGAVARGRASASPRCCARYPEGQRMPWYGPPMSATSMATARFMETWAHSLDVYAALGVEPEVSDRVRHVAHLGVRTRNFSFATHGEAPPAEEFLVSLTAPSGERVDVGARGRRADGDRAGVRLLPAGHPAHPPRRHRPGRRRSRRRPLARHRAVLRGSVGGGAAALVADAIRIGNCSGFYGDRLSAMREMLEGGPLDVLTGDYLAELTMLILGRDQLKDPSLGYARTFVAAGRGLSRPGARAGREDRLQRRRPQPRRPRRPAPRGRARARPVDPRSPTSTATTCARSASTAR